MIKKLLFGSNERVDVPDALAIHDLVDQARRSDTRGVMNLPADGPVVVRGFTCRVNPADDTQILITPGVALMRELLPDGTIEDGQLVNMEGEADETIDMSGRPAGDYGVWVRFLYRDGETRNRAKWRPDLSPEREQVVLTETRQIGGISVAADTAPPGPEWFQIAAVHWDGGLVAADLTDARRLFFEGTPSGTGNPASSWSTADFSRSSDRSTNGVNSLRQFVAAAQRRVLELAGRPKWYTAPVWGENVRSAGASVTVRPVTHGGDVQTAHLTLGTAAQNRATLTLMMIAPNHRTAGDPRTDICLLPENAENSVIEVDCSAGSIQAAGAAFRRRVYGGATLKRDAGNNDLISTPAPASAAGFVAAFDGLTFTATDGNGALIRSRHAGDDLVFSNCVFDGTGTAEMTTLVKLEAPRGARATFINCRFLLRAGQTALLISGETDVRMLGGSISGAGARGLNITSSPTGIVSLVGVRIADVVTCVKATDNDGLSFSGCVFEPGTTLFDIPGLPAAGGAEAFYNAGHAARGLLSGNWLESRSGTIFFSTGQARTLQHTDRTITGTGSDGDLVDFVGRFLRAASGRVFLGNADLRFQRMSNVRVALIDGGETAPGNSFFQAGHLILGDNVEGGWMSRNQIPKAWGVIRMSYLWIAGADVGDRATGADGYYESRTVRGSGDPLTVQAYYLFDTGAAFNLTPDPGAGDRNAVIFKVSGLGLPDARYEVRAFAVYDGTYAWDYNGGNARPSTVLETSVFSQGPDSFLIAVAKIAGDGGRRTLNPTDFLGVGTHRELRIGFSVNAIVDDATFQNGGNG